MLGVFLCPELRPTIVAPSALALGPVPAHQLLSVTLCAVCALLLSDASSPAVLGVQGTLLCMLNTSVGEFPTISVHRVNSRDNSQEFSA